MTAKILLRLYEELNDSLPPDKQKRRFEFPLGAICTVAELLRALSYLDKRVELVLVNGASVGLSHPLNDGDIVSLYPVFESLDVTPLIRIRERPLRKTRFTAGPGLIRLARYLRLLGFDTLIPRSRGAQKIARISEEEQRILLTRNSSSLQSAELSRMYRVQAAEPRDQLNEVLARFDLFNEVHVSGLQLMLARILHSKPIPQ